MAKRCKLTGKDVQSGNNVAHSNLKTKKKFLPNIQNITFFSEILKSKFSLKVATSSIRSVDINGGFDNYLLSTFNNKLNDKVVAIKRRIQKKIKLAVDSRV